MPIVVFEHALEPWTGLVPDLITDARWTRRRAVEDVRRAGAGEDLHPFARRARDDIGEVVAVEIARRQCRPYASASSAPPTSESLS